MPKAKDYRAVGMGIDLSFMGAFFDLYYSRLSPTLIMSVLVVRPDLSLLAIQYDFFSSRENRDCSHFTTSSAPVSSH